MKSRFKNEKDVFTYSIYMYSVRCHGSTNVLVTKNDAATIQLSHSIIGKALIYTVNQLCTSLSTATIQGAPSKYGI